MHLYNLTLKAPDAAVQAVAGNFSGTRRQEVLISRGTALEILRVDAQTGKLLCIASVDVFASIRSLESFRLLGNTKDYVVVGSDSGRLIILEYSEALGSFVKLHQETFGKSGARRIVPGQFLATDPKGRSVMIAAVEKAKLVYTVNRDAAANITISSPLEAHAPGTIIHHIVGLDAGFENPMFAVLEVDYTESDRDPTGNVAKNAGKMLTFYELDLGLNHIVCKWSEPTHPRANLLVQVPGGTGGPSGILVCCEDCIIYQRMNAVPHRVPIPRRTGSERGLLIVAATLHKMKDRFFFLLQSEVGDLYKVTIDSSDDAVHALKIEYFDTVPVSSSLCILETGFLFVASEFGNQCLYLFQALGEDGHEAEYSSAAYPSLGVADALPRVHFHPRALRNLVLTDEIPALNPIIQSKILHVARPGESPQITAVCGRGPRSTLRMLRHGLAVEELVSCDVGSSPNGLWVTKRAETDRKDVYIVLSFANGTLVISIVEDLVEVQDTGFLSSVRSLAVQQLGADSLVQVHPGGVRHILATGQVWEWAALPGNTIIAAASNKRQVVVALSSAEIVYFELDLDGQLNEYQDRKAMRSAVLALGLADVPDGRQRTSYLAVGCEDQTVRIFSLDPEHTLEILSLQTLVSPPSSICIVEVPGSTAQTTYFIHIGLQNGVLLRTVLDTSTGNLVDTRSRFIGLNPIRLSRVKLRGAGAKLVLSSRPWIEYTHDNQTRFAPLIYDQLQYGCSFSHDVYSDGFVGIVDSELRIFWLPKIDDQLNQRSIPLSYTPRQLVSHSSNGYLYIAESDHRVMSDAAIEIRQKSQEDPVEFSDTDYLTFGRPTAPAGTWSSCIRVVDPVKETTFALIPLSENEAAFSVAIVPFDLLHGELVLVVGTATGVVMELRAFDCAFLRTYKFTRSGELELYHTTEVDDVPLALLAFQGRLLAGIGKALRIYDIGKQKLLRKAENSSFATTIVTLNTQGSRIVAGDMQQSLTFLAYNPVDNRLLVVADDTQARWTTCATMVDYNTVVAGDRFGNVFVNRLDPKISDQDLTLREKGQLNGAPHKTHMLAHFHVGDLLTSVHKTALVAGARDLILYTGLHGTLGILASLVGRDHLSWRGYYTPVKAVVDEDLCETFARLPAETQRVIAGELGCTVGEVLQKIEQMRIMASGF
ncbi:mono-functional DNA-alkylating methyl methanesulfonate N-term-domain-containing protein [Mycena epipterygia]|nr:mono-functional DNA-alkylating methyl methanesulfonate N-term-domain-containing protein [Mycena epipterygia]